LFKNLTFLENPMLPQNQVPWGICPNLTFLENVLSDYTRKSSAGLLPISSGVGSPWAMGIIHTGISNMWHIM
jgi:hypothetical protein